VDRDNGYGFDTSAAAREGHFGIAMMRKRAKVGGGTPGIASTRHGGTVITVRFPHASLEPPEAGSDQVIDMLRVWACGRLG